MYLSQSSAGIMLSPIEEEGGGADFGPLAENTAFINRITGASVYTDDQTVTGNFSPASIRSALYPEISSGGGTHIQYDPILCAILCRDVERFVNGTQSGIDPNDEGYSDLVTPSAATVAEWEDLASKVLNNYLNSFRGNPNQQEEFGMFEGVTNCYVDSIDARGSKGQTVVSPAAIQTSDWNRWDANPGNPAFDEKTKNDPPGTYTDAASVTQMQFWSDVPSLRRAAYPLEMAAGAIRAGITVPGRTWYDRIRGYGDAATWTVGSPQFDAKRTADQIEWYVGWAEAHMHEVKGAATDGPTTSIWPDAPTRKWDDVEGQPNHNDLDFRWAPWFMGIMTQAIIQYIEAELFQVNDPDQYYVGASGFSSFYTQLEDFLLWAKDSKTHPDSIDTPNVNMYDTDGTYKTFRFMDRKTSGSGSTTFDEISTQLGGCYAWCAKQRALGNAALGVTKDIGTAETLMAVHDQVFNHCQARSPYIRSDGTGIYNLKELGELYNPCIKGWFWRLEAQGIATGRNWF